MTEFYLGEPVEREVIGKKLRVEHLADHTLIKYGNKSLTLRNESVLEGLASAVEWAIKDLADINRLCYVRRKNGLSYPACCKKEVCPGPKECGDPMYLLDDGVFVDIFSHEGLPWPIPN